MGLLLSYAVLRAEPIVASVAIKALERQPFTLHARCVGYGTERKQSSKSVVQVANGICTANKM